MECASAKNVELLFRIWKKPSSCQGRAHHNFSRNANSRNPSPLLHTSVEGYRSFKSKCCTWSEYTDLHRPRNSNENREEGQKISEYLICVVLRPNIALSHKLSASQCGRHMKHHKAGEEQVNTQIPIVYLSSSRPSSPTYAKSCRPLCKNQHTLRYVQSKAPSQTPKAIKMNEIKNSTTQPPQRLQLIALSSNPDRYREISGKLHEGNCQKFINIHLELNIFNSISILIHQETTSEPSCHLQLVPAHQQHLSLADWLLLWRSELPNRMCPFLWLQQQQLRWQRPLKCQ